ncbi:MAG: hypothetical protein HY541_02725 [Deltaproteobacteria bacterium]|nr:hypothetical protein [Deltaproteobacteria bacterium]
MMHQDEKWAARHFDDLVKRYGGYYVGILSGKILARGKTPMQVIKKAKLEKPEQLYLFKVPTKKELICLL